MVKTTTIKRIFCNVCEKELVDTGIRTNGGKFEEPFLKYDEDIALCYSCAGKIFSRKIVRNLSKEDLQQMIKDLVRVTGSDPLGAYSLDSKDLKLFS